ncbi:hypothetical protein FRC14_002881 [Serendipita sp. 396]|nr:hypothetical protein FRC14_002881 [Serendipita sp. 396]
MGAHISPDTAIILTFQALRYKGLILCLVTWWRKNPPPEWALIRWIGVDSPPRGGGVDAGAGAGVVAGGDASQTPTDLGSGPGSALGAQSTGDPSTNPVSSSDAAALTPASSNDAVGTKNLTGDSTGDPSNGSGVSNGGRGTHHAHDGDHPHRRGSHHYKQHTNGNHHHRHTKRSRVPVATSTAQTSMPPEAKELFGKLYNIVRQLEGAIGALKDGKPIAEAEGALK